MATKEQEHLSEKRYEIKSLSQDDIQEVRQFVINFFYKYEPICRAIHVIDLSVDPPIDPAEGDGFPEKCIDSGTSLKATSMDGKIVGICLNLTQSRGQAEDAVEEDNPKFLQIFKYLEFVQKQVDLFQRYPEVNKILEIHIVAVDDNWKMMGLANALIQNSRDVASKHGCDMVVIHCTSVYSCKVAAKLGFECIYTFNYADFTKEDGTPYFIPESPHTSSSVYIVKV